MTSTSISQEMLSYFMQLNDTEKNSVLEMLKTFVGNRKKEPIPQSLQEYNHELEKADAEIEDGEYVLHEDLMKQYKSS